MVFIKIISPLSYLYLRAFEGTPEPYQIHLLINFFAGEVKNHLFLERLSYKTLVKQKFVTLKN
jgi:hypothetical protein